MYAESWLADPLNNTHRKVYLGPSLYSLSPFLSYVLLLSLIGSRSASSSVASLNAVRISNKKHTGSSNTSSCHECLQAHLFHGNFSTPSLRLHWKLLRIWILYGARRLCTKRRWLHDKDQVCLYQLHETLTTSKHEKWWKYRKPFTTSFKRVHISWPHKKNIVDCLSQLCWQIFWPALGHDIWRVLPAHQAEFLDPAEWKSEHPEKKWPQKRSFWWSWC